MQDAPRVREVVPSLPRALDDAGRAMLAKDPARRLADGAAVLAALDGLGCVAELGRRRRSGLRRRLQPALTATEQRIACVVMAGPSQRPPSGAGGARPRR